jgi:DNA invertase Pin-like site-specific DNA recombinase
MKAAIWARVSTTDQHAENQLEVLRTWAASKGLEVTAEFVTEDSAWQGSKPGNGKGAEFDKQRKALVDGARLGKYDVVLLWAIDRLSRKGIEDTLATMRQLYGHKVELWSHQEGWLQTTEERMRELLVSFMAWMAQQESQRRSERIKAGLARRKAEGKQVGGRKPGSKDRKPRATDGYDKAWEEGGARRAAQERTAGTES